MYNRCPGRYISIHAPPRGATISCVFISTSRFISIHAPPRGATELQVLKCTCPKFQFTPLREGRHCRLIHSEKVFRYFNSRPSARGDACMGLVYGAQRYISIHAPPRGATYCRSCGCRWSRHFNSRPSARGDESDAAADVGDAAISIHAPPRGATPRPRPTTTREDEFQFTPLREGRRRKRGAGRFARHFNSRPSARGDAMRGDSGTSDDISIHAPPRGATARQNVGDCIRVFQFTPLREGRPFPHLVRPCGITNFNSRPSARGDRACRFLVFCGFPFQFTPLREGRPARTQARGPGRPVFQFTPLREGRPATASSGRPRWRFQFTPLREGRRRRTPRPMSAGHGFQFTPLREGRRFAVRQSHSPPRHFNSRPSARGDPRATRTGTNLSISIHAPPRGATPLFVLVAIYRRLFQFTPLREGRRVLFQAKFNKSLFQFTPLREGRL